ncbi:hypothetical protein [Deinococcus marmoris]|uniref:hypothetical protein n=1 Tax=Deinococcus marmoris TaxID=249408 RepID=UPI00096A535A|nr:hypothetical protein [Deinococcus marmoris]
MSEKNLWLVDRNDLIGPLKFLIAGINAQLVQARAQKRNRSMEKEFLLKAMEIRECALGVARALDQEHLLPFVPVVEENPVVACCPECGYEDRENKEWEEKGIWQLGVQSWTMTQMRDLLPDPLHQHYVVYGLELSMGYEVNEDRTKLKATEMLCRVCKHREETLAADGARCPGSDHELWMLTQHPEVLLLRRWQVLGPRMALHDN